jgi:hypothetical protein
MSLLEKLIIGILILDFLGILLVGFICFRLNAIVKKLEAMRHGLNAALYRLAPLETSEEVDVEQLRKDLEGKS